MGWYQSCWLRWCVLMVFCCVRAVAAAGWPAPVSAADAGRVKETNWGCAWGCGRDYPHPIPVSGPLVRQRGPRGQGPHWHALCSVQKTPLLRLSLVFPSHDPFPPVVQAHLSQGLSALTSLLLGIKEDFQEGRWCVVKTDVTKKNAYFSSLAVLTNTQSPENYL